MLRLLPFCFALLTAGCAGDPASKVRKKADLFLRASSDSEVRELVFLPPDLDPPQADRIVKQCLLMVNSLEPGVTIDEIEVKGRWAGIKLSSLEPEALVALCMDDEWRIFWDPAGTLMWGEQEWHSLLSETDWDDYQSLKRTMAE